MSAVARRRAPRRGGSASRGSRAAGWRRGSSSALLVVGLTIADPAGFWTARNIANILTATIVLGLVALGQNLVVLTGGIDLSVGSMASLSALLTALLIDGYPIRTLPVIVLVLLIGALVGAAPRRAHRTRRPGRRSSSRSPPSTCCRGSRS